MKNLSKVAILGAVLAVMTGCSTVSGFLGKRDNGSLDYLSSKKAEPILLPANQQSAEFVPLYTTPTVGDNQLQLTNEAGKQYELPKPPQVRR
ncbi:hypothetical protein B0181_02765 [Moraxella caviae]|uniref:Lipoprotein n=1 Tax=Moraxella caviae TaxID=34060 RepID=A0A1T0A7E8_9GAMM|nr:hypothetical protein [Moraxella caviae]OOR91682.1 hypothetical protein B0181_02765 [Moraxella caviae]STZ10397.1 Uncharacterised protein [Moraxella caviae]